MKKKGISIKIKMHIFIIVTILFVALGTAAVAFYTSANQIDSYYKRCTVDNAGNFASMVDGDFLARLRRDAESDEYQELRTKAEEEENEEIIKEHLVEQDLWDDYSRTQSMLDSYIKNMKDVKYLYIVALDEENAKEDMYLVDSSEEAIYETGLFEEREKELEGLGLEDLKKPTISKGNWGWLCSAYFPVYSSEGDLVCAVGCDLNMEDIMRERGELQRYLLIGALSLTLLVQIIATIIINKTVVKPLKMMTKEMKKFKPAENISNEEAGVIDLPIKSHDEIGAIYNGIRTMQINILNNLTDMLSLQKDKIKAEQDVKNKEKQICRLSEENNKDALTGVGSKSAYAHKVEELNSKMSDGNAEFAIVMVDMNNLKRVNDEFGHKSGDRYIIGCCKMICDAFKHSPVYRIGGDEFVVVAEGSDYCERYRILDDLKKSFAKSYEQDDRDLYLRYSASLGIAENRSDDTTVELVFRRADKAMYEDKKQFKKQHGSYR